MEAELDSEEIIIKDIRIDPVSGKTFEIDPAEAEAPPAFRKPGAEKAEKQAKEAQLEAAATAAGGTDADGAVPPEAEAGAEGAA